MDALSRPSTDLGRRERGKVALVRVDLNVPMDDGAGHRRDPHPRQRADDPRTGRRKGAKVLLLAHFGRPEGARSST